MTNRPITLHWSYAYDSGSQAPLFGRHIERLLARTCDPAHQKGDAEQCYAILPNFWNGYKTAAEITAYDGITIGKLVLSRRQNPHGRWNYNVRRTNSTSGETASYRFQTRDDLWRTIDGRWTAQTVQSGSGSFDGLEAKGIVEGNRVSLATSGKTIEIGRLEAADTIVPFWAISDWVTSGATDIATAGQFDQVSVLENMSRLRKGVLFKPVGLWLQELPANGLKVAMQGFMLFGQGLPPVYWWFAGDGRLLIVSTTFQTYVLTKADAVDTQEDATL